MHKMETDTSVSSVSSDSSDSEEDTAVAVESRQIGSEANVREVRSVFRKIQKNLECPICLELLSNPYTTKCGHPFCRECICTVISSTKKARCPLCKESITKRSLNENTRLGEIVEAVKELEQAIIKDTGIPSTPDRPLPPHSHEATGTPGLIMHSKLHPTPRKPHPQKPGNSSRDIDTDEVRTKPCPSANAHHNTRTTVRRSLSLRRKRPRFSTKMASIHVNDQVAEQQQAEQSITKKRRILKQGGGDKIHTSLEHDVDKEASTSTVYHEDKDTTHTRKEAIPQSLIEYHEDREAVSERETSLEDRGGSSHTQDKQVTAHTSLQGGDNLSNIVYDQDSSDELPHTLGVGEKGNTSQTIFDPNTGQDSANTSLEHGEDRTTANKEESSHTSVQDREDREHIAHASHQEGKVFHQDSMCTPPHTQAQHHGDKVETERALTSLQHNTQNTVPAVFHQDTNGTLPQAQVVGGRRETTTVQETPFLTINQSQTAACSAEEGSGEIKCHRSCIRPEGGSRANASCTHVEEKCSEINCHRNCIFPEGGIAATDSGIKCNAKSVVFETLDCESESVLVKNKQSCSKEAEILAYETQILPDRDEMIMYQTEDPAESQDLLCETQLLANEHDHHLMAYETQLLPNETDWEDIDSDHQYVDETQLLDNEGATPSPVFDEFETASLDETRLGNDPFPTLANTHTPLLVGTSPSRTLSSTKLIGNEGTSPYQTQLIIPKERGTSSSSSDETCLVSERNSSFSQLDEIQLRASEERSTPSPVYNDTRTSLMSSQSPDVIVISPTSMSYEKSGTQASMRSDTDMSPCIALQNIEHENRNAALIRDTGMEGGMGDSETMDEMGMGNSKSIGGMGYRKRCASTIPLTHNVHMIPDSYAYSSLSCAHSHSYSEALKTPILQVPDTPLVPADTPLTPTDTPLAESDTCSLDLCRDQVPSSQASPSLYASQHDTLLPGLGKLLHGNASRSSNAGTNIITDVITSEKCYSADEFNSYKSDANDCTSGRRSKTDDKLYEKSIYSRTNKSSNRMNSSRASVARSSGQVMDVSLTSQELSAVREQMEDEEREIEALEAALIRAQHSNMN